MRVRRHLPRGTNWEAVRRSIFPRLARRQFWVLAAGLLGSFLAGYLVAAVLLFPAPIFAASKTVPRVLGLPLERAREVLAEAQLKPLDPIPVRHPTAPRQSVVWQDPPPGVTVPEGTTVELSVSVGPQRIPVPDVAGYEAKIAELLLEAAGLRVGRIDSAQTAAPPGVTVSTRPSAGTPVLPGGRVTLVVSAGAPTIQVPHLIGLTLSEARASLEQAGLALGTYFSRGGTSARPGTVIDQRPAGGTLAAPGTAVHVILARGG
jgi:serine/threonine-protein kinase